MGSKPDIKSRSGIDVIRAVKSAAWSALVAFGLFLPLIGFYTDQGPAGALVVTTRFGSLAIMVCSSRR